MLSAIKWNFTKFIIDKNGQPVGRYAATTDPFVSWKNDSPLLKISPQKTLTNDVITFSGHGKGFAQILKSIIPQRLYNGLEISKYEFPSRNCCLVALI